VKDVEVPRSIQDDLERLYRAHAEPLWRAVFAFSGDREVASDAVAEAFVQVIGRGSAVKAPDRWVWRAAFRIAAGELKARRRRIQTQPESAYEMPEPLNEVLRALARLSPRQRSSIVLHHYAGYPVRDVAGILGSTSGAVRVHLSIGRQRLRRLLEASDG
jgi:RNA polymerase sigma-70 factor (ECF subfamily)